MMTNSVAKLLVAEDEETLSFFLQQSLEDATPPFVVEVVDAGDKALKKVLTDRFDLMIVDLRLPDMDGLALIRAVRQFDPFMKVIVMTAYGSPETEQEASKLGIQGYVTKPFIIEDMKRLINRTMTEELSYARRLEA
jgi:DNA-binding NtrC family response regulator